MYYSVRVKESLFFYGVSFFTFVSVVDKVEHPQVFPCSRTYFAITSRESFDVYFDILGSHTGVHQSTDNDVCVMMFLKGRQC